jgi:Tol biopolymer transport system component
MGDNGLGLHNLVSGTSQPLPNTDPTDYRMVWSPDGNRIAFIRSGTDKILAIHLDGSEPQQVRDNSAVYHALVGWADNTHLLITEPGPEGVVIQSLDLADGSTENLFSISSNKADTVVSPDARWIAFTDSLGGMLGNGLYVSRLDGAERRMVAALDGRALYFPIWSPDSRWLILGLPDADDAADQTAQALVELETCRIVPLPDLGGEVVSWGR